MAHKNIFLRSVVIGAAAISIAASLTAPAQARGGRDHVPLKTAQEFSQPAKVAKFSLFGKRNAVSKAVRGKQLKGHKVNSSTVSGVKHFK